MTKITFYQGVDGSFHGFHSQDHAGYSAEGQDIVCAGVSSAVRLAANLMTECFQIPAVVTVAENEIQIQLPSSARTQNAVRILNGLLLELQQIQAEFPDYLEIEHMEVSTSC